MTDMGADDFLTMVAQLQHQDPTAMDNTVRGAAGSV